MRTAASASALQRRSLRRLAFRRWQASHPPTAEGLETTRAAAPTGTPDDAGAAEPSAWPKRAARAVAGSVRAHPFAWLLGAAGFGAGCALLASVAKNARKPPRPAPPASLEEEQLALACRMDCAMLPAAGLQPLPYGVQVAVTLVPLAPPV